MKKILLVTLDPELEGSLHNDPHYINAMMQENWAQMADMVLQVVGSHLKDTPQAVDELQWGGYLAVDRSTREFVGSCCYKSSPDKDGKVEIAYFTYPAFEGRGYATAMASKLIQLASISPQVRQILAHTLPQKNASTRVLEKANMCYVGEVVDPEDGKVWRWQIRVESEGTSGA